MQQKYKKNIIESERAGGPHGTTLNWKVKNEEELVRGPSEKRVPFQTERHILSQEARGGMRYPEPQVIS